MSRKREREIECELAFHAEREAMETDARQAAIQLGVLEHWKEEARAARAGALGTALAAWGRDLRLALRGLRRAPGFAATAILILGLGIGANTAVFSVVEAVLLQPPPFAQPQRLDYLWETDTRQPGSQTTVSYPDFEDLRAVPGLAEAAAFTTADMTLTGVGEPMHVRVAAVSDSLFSMLGVRPAVGRGFLPGEDKPGSLAGMDAAVLTAKVAKQKFGTAATALGQRLTLDGRPYRVVGVMPAGFQFPLDDHEDLWVTMAPLTVLTITAMRGDHSLQAVVRLRPGATAAGTEAQLETRMAGMAKAHPDDDAHRGVRLVPMLADYTAATGPVLWLLLGAVGLVLLIACVNVAGLMLARSLRRRPEFALRAALGASRGTVLRQLTCESLAVGLLGAMAGIWIAQAAITGLVRLGPGDVVRLDQARLSPQVLLFALTLGIITALLFGLVPAVELARSERAGRLGGVMQQGARTLGGAAHHAWRRGLVAAQFGLALAVLAGALLLLHSLGRLLGVNPGFSAGHVLTASINISDARYPTPNDQARFFDQLVERLRSQSGIGSAAAAMPVPFTGYDIGVTFDRPDHPLPAAEQPSTQIAVVTPDYFRTLEIPVLQGRGFGEQDRHGQREVAIVNQAFANKFLAGQTVVGARITPGISAYAGPEAVRTIVGVVGNTRQRSLASTDPPMVYIPVDQMPFDGLILAVRTRAGGEAAAGAAIRAAVHGLDPDVPVFDLKPLGDYLGQSAAAAKFDALLLGLFAGLALLLAAVGLYAVMAQAVAQRRREIGIRMALGASRGEIRALVVREGMAMAAIGVGCGLVLAWLLTRALASALSANLYATSLLDPLAFLGAPVLLCAVAWLAAAAQARRAAAADPVAALRLE